MFQKVIEGLKIGLLVAILFFVWKVFNKHDVKVDKQISSTQLQSNEKAKIIVNPQTNKVTVIETLPNGTTTYSTGYYNPRGTTNITELKNGQLEFNERKWGTDHIPFIGLGYSVGDKVKVRVDGGVSLFYVYQFDLVVGLSVDTSMQEWPRVFTGVSYNPRRNVLLYGGVDNTFTPHLGLGVRF